MIPNTDPFTSKYVKEGWTSYGFDYLASFDQDYEDLKAFGYQNTFNYTKEGSFYSLGGYVRELNIGNMTRQQALKTLDTINVNGFIDKQTRSIVLDMILFNSYTDMFTMITFVATFEANGLLSPTVEMYNLKRKSYQGVYGAVRIFCEVSFILLLIFYLLIEIFEIKGKYAG